MSGDVKQQTSVPQGTPEKIIEVHEKVFCGFFFLNSISFLNLLVI